MNQYQEYYKNLPDHRLINIIQEPQKYNQEATKAAKEEMENRGLSTDTNDYVLKPEANHLADIADRVKSLIPHVEIIPSENLFDTLNPIQKDDLAKATKAYRIILICLVISIFLSLLELVPFLIAFAKDPLYDIGFGITILLFLTIILYAGSFLFYKKKELGWKLIYFYFLLSVVGSVFNTGLYIYGMIVEFQYISFPMVLTFAQSLFYLVIEYLVLSQIISSAIRKHIFTISREDILLISGVAAIAIGGIVFIGYNLY